MQPSNINRVIAIFLTGFMALGLMHLGETSWFESIKSRFPSEITWQAFMLAATVLAGLMLEAITEPLLRTFGKNFRKAPLLSRYARDKEAREAKRFQAVLEKTLCWRRYSCEKTVSLIINEKSQDARAEIALAYFFGSSLDWQKNWAATHSALHILCVNLGIILLLGVGMASLKIVTLPMSLSSTVVIGITGSFLLIRLGQVYVLQCWQVTYRQARLHIEQLEWDRFGSHVSSKSDVASASEDATGYES